MCRAIYIGKTHQKFRKIMGGQLSLLLRILKNEQKSDSFATYFKHRFKYTTSCTYLRKLMTFKIVKQFIPIGEMKTLTKPDCGLCIKERLIILKNLCGKHVTVMHNNSDMYGAFRHKTTFCRFCLSTDDPV